MASISTPFPGGVSELDAPPLDRTAHNRLSLRWGYGLAAFPVVAVLVTLLLVWHSRDASHFGVREAFVSVMLTAAVSVALGAAVTLLIRFLAYNKTRAEDRAGLRRVIAGVGLAASAWLAFVAALLVAWGMIGDM